MKNTLPKSKSGLISKASVVVEALGDHAGPIGLLHVTMGLVDEQLTELRTACGNHDAGKLERTARKDVLHAMIAEARAFSMTTRDVLKPHLGNKYGEAWNGTGFVNSLTVPSLGPALQPLLLSFSQYLTLRPAHENAVLKITAMRAHQLFISLGAARSAVLAQEAVLKALFEVREQKATQLRQTLRMLLDEMGMKLSPLDPRWLAFGFNMPGKKQRPTAPMNITATEVGPNTLAVEWDKPPRAEHFRVWLQVEGSGEDFVAIGSPSDPDFTIEEVPPGSTVRIAVTAVNPAGESGRSEVLIVKRSLPSEARNGLENEISEMIRRDSL